MTSKAEYNSIYINSHTFIHITRTKQNKKLSIVYNFQPQLSIAVNVLYFGRLCHLTLKLTAYLLVCIWGSYCSHGTGLLPPYFTCSITWLYQLQMFELQPHSVQQSVTWTKWVTSCRQNNQMYFNEWTLLHSNSNFADAITMWPI